MKHRRSQAPQPLSQTTLNATVSEILAIYQTWESHTPPHSCIGRADCCRFKKVGHTPFLTKGEALVAALAWKASGRKSILEPADGSCPFLHPHSGKCQIYHGRPFGCRTHFCPDAGGLPPRKSVRDLIQQLDTIDAKLGGSGPSYLPTAVRHALTLI